MATYFTGDGSTGALSLSGTRTENTQIANLAITGASSSGQKDVTMSNTSGFAAGQMVFIHQTQGTGSGNYEFGVISSVSANIKITLTTKLVNSYGASGAQVVGVSQYTTITINTGAIWQVNGWDGTKGGILVAVARGDITMSDGSITVNSFGFKGGIAQNTTGGNIGWQGDSNSGNGSRVTNANGAGGGAGSLTGNPSGAGAGGGGLAVAGGTGADIQGAVGGKGGGIIGAANLQNGNLFLGNGGGSACGYGINITAGGNGGGILFLVSGGNISFTGGTVFGKGANGGNAIDAQVGGGGGGSGGSVRLLTMNTLALGTGLVSAVAGTGGTIVGGAATVGGDGGNGYVATISSATITGTSTPAINASSTDIVVTNLIPSVSDSTTVSENYNSAFFPLLISVFESTTITERIDLNAIQINDSITTSESITILIPTLLPSVFDSIITSEAWWVNTLHIEPNEVITTSESVTVFIPILTPSVNDLITVSENINIKYFTLSIIPNETTTISELITVLIPTLFLTPVDTITTSDNPFLDKLQLYSPFDSVSVSDVITMSEPAYPSTFDHRPGGRGDIL